MANPTAAEIQAAIKVIDAQIAALQKGAPFSGAIAAQVRDLQKERTDLMMALPLVQGTPTPAATPTAGAAAQGGGGMSNLLGAAGNVAGNVGAAAAQGGAGGAGGLPTGGGTPSTLDQIINEMLGATDPSDALAQLELDWRKTQDALKQKNWETTFGYNQSQDTLSQQNWLDTFLAQQANQQAQLAYQQQQLAQAWQLAQAQMAQEQQQMAAGIGQNVAQMQNQSWAQGLPYALPDVGKRAAPGFEAGGPMSVLAGIAGSAYNPGAYNIEPNPPPSADQMMAWITQAMNQYGG